MLPDNFEFLGYSLRWWWLAVIVPCGGGIRWYLLYRQKNQQDMIGNYARANQQLMQMNALLASQLQAEREQSALDRANWSSRFEQLEARLTTSEKQGYIEVVATSNGAITSEPRS